MTKAVVTQQLANIIEALLAVHSQPLSLDNLQQLLLEKELQPTKPQLKKALAILAEAYQGRALELVEVASGYRLQVSQAYAEWTQLLTDEKPVRFSRAMLETLALIAYRQPITRGEIEDVRGVSVSSNIIRNLQEREWIRIVGYRDVPGKPAMFATTKSFLDYFNLKGLEELPSLMALRDLSEVEASQPQQLQLSAKTEITTEQLLAGHADQQQTLSFKNLLDELDGMEQNLVTDFTDLAHTDD